MNRYLEHIIESTEKRVETFLLTQDKKPESLQYGGMRSEIWDSKATIFAMTDAVAVYLLPQSRFYKNPRLFEAMHLALQYIRNNQRSDGTFDYASCNFKSAPDTSFSFERLAAAFKLISQAEPTEEIEVLKRKYSVIMKDALVGICSGGFHTPNHRWAICAALYQGISIFASNLSLVHSCRTQIKPYIDEGIDIDEDGEYAERSTGNYNAVVNSAMITLFEETGDQKYLEIVKKNLSMMLYYIDPDDTVFTQNSTRQDMGTKVYADMYFYQYLWVCTKEDNPTFDAAAHKLIQDNMKRGDMAPDILYFLMLDPKMRDYTFKGYGFVNSYRKLFPNTGVLRVRKENFAYTVLNGKSTFLYIKYGGESFYMKIGESYGSIRNFIPQEISVEDCSTTLHAHAEGHYYLPFKTPPETSDWWQMPNDERQVLVSSELDTTLTIREIDGGLEFSLHTEGLDRLPLRVIFGIMKGSVLENKHLWLRANAGGSMILRDDNLTITSGETQFLLGEGFGEHEFQGHYSNEEKNLNDFTVYMNAYTPCDKTFSLRVKK